MNDIIEHGLTCAEQDCDKTPTLKLVLSDGIGDYDIAFACSNIHFATMMRATKHISEGWFPYQITRTIKLIPVEKEHENE